MTFYSSKDVAYVFNGTYDCHSPLTSIRMKVDAKLVDTVDDLGLIEDVVLGLGVAGLAEELVQ